MAIRFSSTFYLIGVILLALVNGIVQANPTINLSAFLGGACAGSIGGLVVWGILHLFKRKPTLLQCMFWVSVWCFVQLGITNLGRPH
jgi:hypothetical protein